LGAHHTCVLILMVEYFHPKENHPFCLPFPHTFNHVYTSNMYCRLRTFDFHSLVMQLLFIIHFVFMFIVVIYFNFVFHVLFSFIKSSTII
jgi:hypothetical protein